jgi:hypothetical protein
LTQGQQLETSLEHILELMLPRYVSLLDKHMRTIQTWTRPMMRAVHHLLSTMIFAEGSFTVYLNEQSVRSLINHLLRLVCETRFIATLHQTGTSLPSVLINTALIILNVLVYERDALDYLKQCQSVRFFRALTSANNESIVLNAYMMLAYTMNERDLRNSSDDFIRLFHTTIGLLKGVHQSIEGNKSNEKISRTFLQLLETLRGRYHMTDNNASLLIYLFIYLLVLPFHCHRFNTTRTNQR